MLACYEKLMLSINLILGIHSLLLWSRQRREKNGVIISFYSKQFASHLFRIFPPGIPVTE